MVYSIPSFPRQASILPFLIALSNSFINIDSSKLLLLFLSMPIYSSFLFYPHGVDFLNFFINFFFSIFCSPTLPLSFALPFFHYSKFIPHNFVLVNLLTFKRSFFQSCLFFSNIILVATVLAFLNSINLPKSPSFKKVLSLFFLLLVTCSHSSSLNWYTFFLLLFCFLLSVSPLSLPWLPFLP